jgi:glycosylphosphatidylinositol transamidase
MLLKRRAFNFIMPLLKYAIVLYLIGILLLFALPLSLVHQNASSDERSLLTGQVSKHFFENDHVYTDTLPEHLWNSDQEHASFIEFEFKSLGFDTTIQHFSSLVNGSIRTAQNVHGILRSPRAEGTECIIISAPWRTMDGSSNRDGIHLILNIAKYFKKWSYWAVDFIFLVTDDPTIGTYAWLQAYHGLEQSSDG